MTALNAPTSGAPAVRASLRTVCANHMQARAFIKGEADKPFTWVEAVPSIDPGSVIGYAVHTGQIDDVPPFAIEVYEFGALRSYEIEKDNIVAWSTMSEQDRQVSLRALQAQATLDAAAVTSLASRPAA
jgi:hypothetical protein